MTTTNAYHQPVGQPVPGWQGAKRLSPVTLTGQRVRIEPLDADRHGDALFTAWQAPDAAPETRNALAARWTYLGGRPFDDGPGCHAWLADRVASVDPCFHAIVDAASGQALGIAAYLNIVPEHGSVEVGHLHFSPRLARTTAATEAMVLMMGHAFAMGYRRYEWKCDALNAPSRRAAERLGFRFEGIFRQHRVVQGHNRDTAWFSVLDGDWQALEPAFACWLAADNFDPQGRQRRPLGELTEAALAVS
ncbi:Protein N-acetyltransferase, RimJ/RimL family [Onishia taeanensis]|uniref:Protein N-acetyltransferase, RimJ/RimL family n=1 Tax=Onishia taeanensis TaxID=284577 RepID=A0A1G7MSW0_9GAMM|nr:GNAT family protein [Halomonas taeanensis]SDF64209.1 Protein N-acetyltransferase, RimJ/RimL family [Halomonas taeanensis]